jgi:hypothetical protein
MLIGFKAFQNEDQKVTFVNTVVFFNIRERVILCFILLCVEIN